GGVTLPGAGTDAPPAEASPTSEGWHLLALERRVPPGAPPLYFLPLGPPLGNDRQGAPRKICEGRRLPRNGSLFDAATEPDFVLPLCRAIADDAAIAGPLGEVRFRRAGMLPETLLAMARRGEAPPDEGPLVRRLPDGLASSAAQIGEAAV